MNDTSTGQGGKPAEDDLFTSRVGDDRHDIMAVAQAAGVYEGRHRTRHSRPRRYVTDLAAWIWAGIKSIRRNPWPAAGWVALVYFCVALYYMLGGGR